MAGGMSVQASPYVIVLYVMLLKNTDFFEACGAICGIIRPVI